MPFSPVEDGNFETFKECPKKYYTPLVSLRVADWDTKNLEEYILEFLEKHDAGIVHMEANYDNGYDLVADFSHQDLARYIAERMNGII